jgi:hypothetical protein
LVAALALAIGAADANAASPVLEFASASPFPIAFTAEGGEVSAVLTDFERELHCSGSRGEGELSGPRSATSRYAFTGCEAEGPKCHSPGASVGEIQTPMIAAELVFINQARHEVGVLLAPEGGAYMSFECGGESVTALGPFLAPVGPVNQESTSFTASLSRLGAVQIPDEYEGASGERLEAIPTAERENGLEPGTTGVELSFAIHTSVPLTVKAISTAEIDAKQHDEDAAKAAAAAKNHQEETDAATKKRQEEEAAAKALKEREQAKAKKRARQRSAALKQCRKGSAKQKRARCERRAKKRFGPQVSQAAHRDA